MAGARENYCGMILIWIKTDVDVPIRANLIDHKKRRFVISDIQNRSYNLPGTKQIVRDKRPSSRFSKDLPFRRERLVNVVILNRAIEKSNETVAKVKVDGGWFVIVPTSKY